MHSQENKQIGHRINQTRSKNNEFNYTLDLMCKFLALWEDGSKEKRMISTKMDGLNYDRNECLIGKPERPSWRNILLKKIYLCGC